jgi:hypothetical protein
MTEQAGKNFDRFLTILLVLGTFALVVLGATGPIDQSKLKSLPDWVSRTLQPFWPFRWLAVAVVIGALGYRRRGDLLLGYRRFLEFLLSPVLGNLVRRKQVRKIHYGDEVLFKHFTTGRFLTSLQGQAYRQQDGGSGQQKTFGAAMPDLNSVWIIAAEHGRDRSERDGREIQLGDAIRVFHKATGQCLHSHGIAAPNSKMAAPGDQQHEVTVAAGNNIQDTWYVAEKHIYLFGAKWKFKHSDGNWFLHSHPFPIDINGRSGSYEVTCCSNHNEIGSI